MIPAMIWGLGLSIAAAAIAGSSFAAESAPKAEAGEAEAVDYARLGWKKGLYTLDGQPFTGVAEQRHKGGGLKARYRYRNGMLHGMVEEWLENGRKSVESEFADNVRHGMTLYWDENGKPLKRQRWEKGGLKESSDPDDLPNP